MGGQEDPNQLPGKGRCDHFSSQAKYVHIVVFDALSGGKHIVDEAGSPPGTLFAATEAPTPLPHSAHRVLLVRRRRRGPTE
jgi:hypothetical protein